jgi:hypothetical protein
LKSGSGQIHPILPDRHPPEETRMVPTL